MRIPKPILTLWWGAALLAVVPSAAQVIPAPEEVLGFVPGADSRLVEWPVLVDYYRELANASDRVQYRELGKTTLGAPFVALVISSADNMQRLEPREAKAALQTIVKAVHVSNVGRLELEFRASEGTAGR